MKETPEDIIILQMSIRSFWTAFLSFCPPSNPKNQNFEKMKKTPGDIIILYRCAINYNHMMYGSRGFSRNFLPLGNGVKKKLNLLLKCFFLYHNLFDPEKTYKGKKHP